MLRLLALLVNTSSALRLANKIQKSVDGVVMCLTCGDVPHLNQNMSFRRLPKRCGPQSEEIADMWNMVKKLPVVSDKFVQHTYQTMYGIFLMPWRTSEKGPKLLEIGLGCDMGYGPGASVQAWQAILPTVELWEAEYNEACVNVSRQNGKLSDDVHTVTGDQGNPIVVDRWVQESGGNYDIVIDDGGHHNSQIKTSFDHLWPHVNPGGLYFMEDLQVGRYPSWDDTEGHAVMSDILQLWTEQLLINSEAQLKRHSNMEIVQKHSLPKDVDFIFCQHEACVIGKQKQDFPDKEWK